MSSEKPVAHPNVVDDNETDMVDAMLDRTGCKQIHYDLRQCMFEHKDWRKCKPLVNSLRECMLEYEKNRPQQILEPAEATKK